MKTFITFALIVVISLIPPCIANPEPKKPDCTLLQACAVVVVVGCACYALWQIKMRCDRFLSNIHWQQTNEIDSMLPPLISSNPAWGTVTFQTASGLGSIWSDICHVDLQQVDNNIVGVLYDTDGTSVATNTAAINPSNNTAYLYFPNALPSQRNKPCPPKAVFRLSETP